MNASEQNQANFIDACRGSVHEIADYAPPTRDFDQPGYKLGGKTFYPTRPRKQWEVMAQAIEASHAIQWQLATFIARRAEEGDDLAINLLQLMAVQYDEINEIEEREEEHHA